MIENNNKSPHDKVFRSLMARAMKHIYGKNAVPIFQTISVELNKIKKHGDLSYVYTIITYLAETSDKKDKEKFVNEVITKLNVAEDKIMTMAEAWKEEGKQEERIHTSQKIAEKLLCKGMDTASVSNIVELSEAKIQKIQDNLN